MKRLRYVVPIIAGLFLSGSPSLAGDPVPLIQAHAHNDYRHKRPLLDALDHGFCSVEADIHFVDGKLLVAHDRSELTNAPRTLEQLYLDPLRERVRKNGGRVYPNGPEFSLLIDLKTEWEITYPALRELLYQYADILSNFHSDRKETNAVTVVITGSRALQMFADEEERYAAYDGQLSDLESQQPNTLMPWISSSWTPLFKWRGVGPMPDDEKRKLDEIVSKTHKAGRRLRFWGAPDKPEFWAEMLAHNVDLINTDDLSGLQKLLTARLKPTRKK